MSKYDITGMSCAACSARVQKSVEKLDGVRTCSVNLLTNSMIVEGDVSSESVIAAVEAAGYGARLQTEKDSDRTDASLPKADSEMRGLSLRLIFSFVFLAILMYVSMGHVMLGAPLPRSLADNPLAIGILQMLLSAIIMIVNQKFFINGFRGIIRLSPNMDTLVSLGSASAFVYSTVILFIMTSAPHSEIHSYLHELYFESAAMVLALITLGKMLETRAKGKTTNAIKSLMDLAPKTANVIRDGNEMTVSAESVRIGDVFIVRPGERIPVDAVVIDGISAVDESALTGESIPSDKRVGDTVSAGTINRSGVMRCEARRVGEDTTLSQIIKIVNDASATKAPIAKIADKVSGVFVPIVIVISLISFLCWMLADRSFGFALARAISVLVISCPCALGLATPVAIMVGSGMGARHGILFKNATALEITGKAKIIALDKTGTVTEGMPCVTDIIASADTDEGALLRVAVSLEQNSEHPLAKAVVAYGKENGYEPSKVENFESLSGNGVTALLDGEEICGGNLELVRARVTDIPDELTDKASELSSMGKTPLFFAKQDRLLGIIAVADRIRNDSKEAVSELKRMGIEVAMLTGDNARTAAAIGREAEIDRVFSDVKPDGKERIIRELQQRGPVIMVGDGINDAPALTRADVGIAIGGGTDVAIDSADVVIVNSRLTDVVNAVKLSRSVIRNIHENLFWAFGYNLLGIPLAAGLFIPFFDWQLDPMFAAAAMSISSFLVVSNALRLNLVKLNNKKSHRKKERKMKKTIFVQGMMCPHCEARVKKILEDMEGIVSAEVSHVKGEATVTLSSDISNDALKSVIEAQGYTVTDIK